MNTFKFLSTDILSFFSSPPPQKKNKPKPNRSYVHASEAVQTGLPQDMQATGCMAALQTRSEMSLSQSLRMLDTSALFCWWCLEVQPDCCLALVSRQVFLLPGRVQEENTWPPLHCQAFSVFTFATLSIAVMFLRSWIEVPVL